MPTCTKNNPRAWLERFNCPPSPDHSKESVLVIQGGALRGVHTTGFLTVLAEAGIQFDCIMGISAGALNGLSYLAGELERSLKMNTEFLMDPGYMGRKAVRKSHSMINFGFMFQGRPGELKSFDWTRYLNSRCRFVCGAVNSESGDIRYFEKGSGVNIKKACIASCSLPLITPGVTIDGQLYFDGGVREATMLHKAQEDGYGKIVLLMTRQRGFRSPESSFSMRRLMHIRYFRKPRFLQALNEQDQRYNQLLEEIEALEDACDPRYLVLRPQSDISVNFNDRSPEIIERLIRQGKDEAKAALPELINFLSRTL